MKQNLFNTILEKAIAIRDEFSFEKTNPLCFIIGCLDFISENKYIASDEYEKISAINFEEEMFRFLVDELFFKSSSRYFKILAKLNGKQYDIMDISEFYDTAKELAHQIEDSYCYIRADVMLLLCLKQLDLEHRKTLNDKYSSLDYDIVDTINFVHENVATYTVAKIDTIIATLNKRREKAIWYRDNYPARLVADLDEIADALENSLKIEKQDNVLNVTFPFFFDDENGELVLTVKKHDDHYYIHDNGCTNVRLGKPNQPLCFVMFQDRLMVYFDYILRYVNGFELEEGEHFADTQEVLSVEATQDPSDVFKRIRPMVQYDKQKGTFVYPHMFYMNHATSFSILLCVDKNGTLKVCDGNFGKLEGEVIGFGSSANWYDEIKDTLEKVCNTYGVTVQNNQLCVITDNKNDYVKAIAKYLRSAIIIAHYGFGI